MMRESNENDIENSSNNGSASETNNTTTAPHPSHSGSSNNTTTALIHCQPSSILTPNHSSSSGNGTAASNGFRTSLNDIDDELLDSPIIGGGLIRGNNIPEAINSTNDDHIFSGGISGTSSSSSGGAGSQNGGGSINWGNSSSSSGGSDNNSRLSNDSASKSMFRLVLGVFILLVVDFIWVASSEMSFYLFHDEKFDKPFFSTYVKTSMFLIFLLGFLFWTPWYEQCQKTDAYAYTLLAAEANSIAANLSCSTDESADDAANDALLSPPAFVPINYDTGGSGNESDDSAHQRSVRFSKLAEVRHLSDHEAAEAFYARLSYQASLQAEQLAYRLANRFSPSQTAHLAVSFCLMWFVANYTYQLAVSRTQVGIVNVLSSSSGLFTLMLAALFPAIAADKFSTSKLLSVLVSICGVAVVSLSDMKTETTNLPLGAIFAIVSAFFYAAYLVFLRKKVDNEDKLDIPLFFGFVGLFNLLLLWPLFFVLNYTGIEVFEWPNKRQWVFLVVNGFVGTVFSEVLWLWGCFLTSSLIATLAISLTIPMTMVADVIFKKVSYSWLFYIGSVPVFLSFFALTLLTHYDGWDPVGAFWRRVCKRCWPRGRSSRYQRVMVNDMMDQNEQQESLLENDELEEEDRDEESGFGSENIQGVAASSA